MCLKWLNPHEVGTVKPKIPAAKWHCPWSSVAPSGDPTYVWKATHFVIGESSATNSFCLSKAILDYKRAVEPFSSQSGGVGHCSNGYKVVGVSRMKIHSIFDGVWLPGWWIANNFATTLIKEQWIYKHKKMTLCSMYSMYSCWQKKGEKTHSNNRKVGRIHRYTNIAIKKLTTCRMIE